MRTFGKSIRIYLKDGVTSGIKIGEIVNNTVQALYCPRVRLSELMDFPETRKPGVYFLFGQDDQTNRLKAYIGEGENTYKRLLDHITKKDFWNEVVFFISKDENVTKAHVKYLEGRIVQLAKAADRYKIENPNNSNPASLPLPDRDAMEEFLSHIRILLASFNHLILEPVPGTISQSVGKSINSLPDYENIDNELSRRELSLIVSGTRAEALQTDEGFIVLKGSQAAMQDTNALSPGYKKIRAALVENGQIKLEGSKFIFQENTVFKSPSAAASAIVGFNCNGLQVWRDIAGKNLNEIEATS